MDGDLGALQHRLSTSSFTCHIHALPMPEDHSLDLEWRGQQEAAGDAGHAWTCQLKRLEMEALRWKNGAEREEAEEEGERTDLASPERLPLDSSRYRASTATRGDLPRKPG